MPLYINPAWEYWQPDPDVDALFAAVAATGFDALGVEDLRFAKSSALTGFRFGSGRPDFCPLRFAPDRSRRRPPRSRKCRGCGWSFYPDRTSREHCSRECVDRAPTTPTSLCAECNAPFHPRYAAQVLCSRRCASDRALRSERPRKIDDAVFTSMYSAGASTAEIMACFGVRQAAIKKARKRLGLPAKAVGRPRSSHDVATNA